MNPDALCQEMSKKAAFRARARGWGSCGAIGCSGREERQRWCSAVKLVAVRHMGVWACCSELRGLQDRSCSRVGGPIIRTYDSMGDKEEEQAFTLTIHGSVFRDKPGSAKTTRLLHR